MSREKIEYFLEDITKKELDEIINNLRANFHYDTLLETKIIKLIEELMDNIFEESIKLSSYTELSKEKQKLLEKKLQELIKRLISSGIFTAQEEAINTIIIILSQLFIKKSKFRLKNLNKKKNYDDLNKNEYLHKKEEILKRNHCKVAAIYEFYKAVNPHQIAGETRKHAIIKSIGVQGLKHTLEEFGLKSIKPPKTDKNFIKSISTKIQPALKLPSKLR